MGAYVHVVCVDVYVCARTCMGVGVHKPIGILRLQENIGCPLCLFLLYSLEGRYHFEYRAWPMARKLEQSQKCYSSR